MKKICLIITILILLLTSCTKTSSEGNVDLFNPKSVVEVYLKYINDAKYDRSFGLVDSRLAPVWPGVGLIEQLTNSKIKDKYVEITIKHLSDPVNLGNSPDEKEVIAQLHIKPTERGMQNGLGVERDVNLIFYLIKRNGGYKLSKSFELDSFVANYIETNPELFKNIKSTIPTRVKKGEEVELVFDLDPPKALGNIGEISYVLFPEPTVAKYPHSYETVFYSGDYVGTTIVNGQIVPIETRHFALIKSEGSNFTEEYEIIRDHPDMFHSPVQIDEEIEVGYYRIYLRTGNIFFPIKPYIIEVS